MEMILICKITYMNTIFKNLKYHQESDMTEET